MRVPTPRTGRRRDRVTPLVEAWVRLLIRRPWLTTALLTAATAVAFWVGSGITIRGDMEALFPDHAPSVVRAREAREILGNRSTMQVLVGGPDRETLRAVAGELAAAFARHDDLVDDVRFRRDVGFLEDRALLFLSLEDLRELRQEVIDAIADATRKSMEDEFEFDFGDAAPAGPAPKPERRRLPDDEELRRRFGAEELREYVESPDGRLIAVEVHPRFPPADTDLTRRLDGLLRADVDAVFAAWEARTPGLRLEVAFEGDYAHVTSAVAQIGREALRAFLIALAGVVVLLVLYFHRVRAVVVTFATLVAGTAWTFLFARLAVGQLNLVTAAIFSVVVGLGIDFVVHATSRTDEAYADGLPLERALPYALGRLFGAMTWAVVCATATFFALVLFEFRGFSQFGLLAGVGGLLCLAGAYVFYPPLEAAIARLVPKRRVAERFAAGTAPAREPSRAFGWSVLALFAAATALSATLIPDVDLEADMRTLRTAEPAMASHLRAKYLHEAERRSTSPALVITEDLEATRRLHRALAERAKHDPYLEQVMSIWTFVPDDQEAKLPIIADIKRRIDLKHGLMDAEGKADADRLQRFLTPTAFGVHDLPAWLRDELTDTRGQLGRYVLLHVRGNKSDARHVVEVQDALGTLTLDGRTYHATASWFIFGDAWRIVGREGPWTVAVASLVVLLLLIADLRNARDVVAIYVPICVGFVLTLGVLEALRIPLTVFNVVVLPTVFGMGVDTAIHLVHRLNEGDPLSVVFHTTGRAAAVSVATDMVGFLGLTLMSNEGLRSIGQVALVGLACLYVANTGLIAAFVAVGWKRPRPAPAAGEGAAA